MTSAEEAAEAKMLTDYMRWSDRYERQVKDDLDMLTELFTIAVRRSAGPAGGQGS